MWKKNNIKKLKDFKVIPGNSIIIQRRLMIIEIQTYKRKNYGSIKILYKRPDILSFTRRKRLE